ncbi:MAG: DUF3883 domain-containing protein [Fimbriimonadaceae bacterium]
MARRAKIKPEAIVVAYALSRLGPRLFAEFGWKTWGQAFAATSNALDEGHSSIRLLRDEFDPFFDNGRQGWWKRPPHDSRVAVYVEFAGMSDEALVETVRRILAHDVAPLQEVLAVVDAPVSRVAGVAERLLTGRLAEEHFMRSCKAIVDVAPSRLVDMRQSACGFDFGVSAMPGVAIEVKGLKRARGDVLFTDREWSEALVRRGDYWLVVVGCLPDSPRGSVTRDPSTVLSARCRIVPSSRTEWTATVAI